MKKKTFFSIAIVVCTLALNGCADAMPDLTEEQQDVIAEYSAQQLLKYCSYYDSGIDTKALQEEEMESETDSEAETEQAEDQTSEEPQNTSSDINETQEDGTQAVEVLDASQADLAELLQQDEFEITYAKCEFDTSYPQDENAFFSLDAPEGKQFLVLFFDVQNLSSDEASFDILNSDIKFKMNLNDTGFKSNLSTLLLDDLSTYDDQFAANETKQAVLILQIKSDEADSADSIILQIESEDVISQIKLI